MNASLVPPRDDVEASVTFIRETIVPAVAARYGLPIEDILEAGYEDEHENDWPRDVAMWVAWHATGLHGGHIAKVLGGFEGWCIDALRCVDRVMEQFPEIGENLREFFQEVDCSTFGLLRSIDELDREPRRAA